MLFWESLILETILSMNKCAKPYIILASNFSSQSLASILHLLSVLLLHRFLDFWKIEIGYNDVSITILSSHW